MRIRHVTSRDLPKYGTDELARFVREWRTSNWAFEGKSARLEGSRRAMRPGRTPAAGVWCRWPDLNQRPPAYEADALPTELHRQNGRRVLCLTPARSARKITKERTRGRQPA